MSDATGITRDLEETATLPALLAALAVECERASSDLQRLESVISAFATPQRSVPATAQMVALQDLDRLTQTLSALGRTAEVLGRTLPAQSLGTQALRSATALDSVTDRLLEHATESKKGPVTRPDHTTLF